MVRDEVCFGYFSKDIFLEVKMENVVKNCVYLDISLVGPIYVTTYVFFGNTRNPHHPANPVIQD